MCGAGYIMQELFEQYDVRVLPTFVAVKGGDQVCSSVQLKWDRESLHC